MNLISRISQAIQDQTQSKSRWATHLVIAMSFMVIAIGYLAYDAAQIELVKAQSGGWYSEGGTWDYRQKITIKFSKVKSDQNNFPIFIDIADDNLKGVDFGGHVRVDAGDILFTNFPGVKLDHEIEYYNATLGELKAWIEIDSLSSTVDTEIYMYYGNSSCPNQWNTEGTWDLNYQMVQHLSGNSINTYDSTSNGNFGIKVAPNEPQETAGKLDRAQSFDGINDDIRVVYNDSLDVSSQMTFEGWIRANNPSSGTQHTIIAHSPNANEYNYWFYLEENDLKLTVYSPAYLPASGIIAADVINDTDWHHVAFVATQDDVMMIFVDGNEVASGTAGLDFWTGGYIVIGDLRAGRNLRFNGIIDEIRISNIARSTEWIQTSYNNQSFPADFLNFGPEEKPAILSELEVQAPSQATSGEPFTLTVIAKDQLGNTITSFNQTVNIIASPGSITPTTIGDGTYGTWTEGVVSYDNYVINEVAVHTITAGCSGVIGDDSINIIDGGENNGVFPGIQSSTEWFFGEIDKPMRTEGILPSHPNQLLPVSFYACLEDDGSGASECFAEPILTDFSISTDEVGLFRTHPSNPEWEEVGYLNGIKIEADLKNNIFIQAVVDLGGGEQFVYRSGTFSIVEAEIEVASIVLEVDARTAVGMPFTITASVYDASGNPINNFNEVLAIDVTGPGGVLNPGDIGDDPLSGSWENGSVTFDEYAISATGIYALRVEHNGVIASDTIIVEENAVYIDNPTTGTIWYIDGDGDIIFRSGGIIQPDYLKIFYTETPDIPNTWNQLDSFEEWNINQPQIYTWEDILIDSTPQYDIVIKIESWEDGGTEPIAEGLSDEFTINSSGPRAGVYTTKEFLVDTDSSVYITSLDGFEAIADSDALSALEATLKLAIRFIKEDGSYFGPAADGFYDIDFNETSATLLDRFSDFDLAKIDKIQLRVDMWTSEISHYQPWVESMQLDYTVRTSEEGIIGILNFDPSGADHKSVDQDSSVNYNIVLTPTEAYKDIINQVQLEMAVEGTIIDPITNEEITVEGITITANPNLITFDGSDSYNSTITLWTDDDATVATDIPFYISVLVINPDRPDLGVDPLIGYLDVNGTTQTNDFSISISGTGDKEIIPGGTISFNIAVAFTGDFNEAVILSSNIEDVFDAGVIKSVEFLPSATVTPPGDEIIEMRITIEDDSGEHAKTEFNITGTPEQSDSKTISPKPSLAISDSATEYINIEAVAEVEGSISSDKQYPKFSFRLYQEDVTNSSSWAVDIDNLITDSVVGDKVTINIEISANDVTDGETYVGYLRSTRHLWRKATTPTGGKITINLSDLDYNLEFPKLLAGDVAPTDRDNIINVLDFPEFVITDWHQIVKGLLADFDNNDMINTLDIMFMFRNWFVSGELPGS